MLPDHPPRPVLRHRHEQQPQRRTPASSRTASGRTPSCDMSAYTASLITECRPRSLNDARHPLQPRDAVLHSLVRQPVARPSVRPRHRLDFVVHHEPLLALADHALQQRVLCSPPSPTPCPALRSSGSPSGTAARPPSSSAVVQRQHPGEEHARQSIAVHVQTGVRLGHAFAVFLPSPFRHRQPSSGSGLLRSVCSAPRERPSSRSRARCIFAPSARSIRPRISDSATGSPFAARKWRLSSSDRRARTSASATSPASAPGLRRRGQQRLPNPLGERQPGSHAHALPAAANSASLTLVPTDFVRSGGFIEHRRRLDFRGEATRSPCVAQHRAAGPEAG